MERKGNLNQSLRKSITITCQRENENSYGRGAMVKYLVCKFLSAGLMITVPLKKWNGRFNECCDLNMNTNWSEGFNNMNVVA